MIKLTVNGISHTADADPDTPLLWVIREWLGMTGTKYGCGIAQCGACTVHIDGVATRSCQVPGGLGGRVKITTIEGLSPDGLSHPVQVAWLQHDVPQCGYCQSGQIMAAAALLKTKPKPTDADIDARDHQHLSLRHLSAHPRGDPYRRRHSAARHRRRHHEQHGLHFAAVPSSARLPPLAAASHSAGMFRRLRADAGATGNSASGWSSVRTTRLSCASPAPRWGRARFTGLAQLVADELDCDWKHVRAEYVSPEENLAHKRAWGDMSTGGSRGIRGSVDYVRKGGAAARAMLIEAAAQRWGVPAAECTAANSVLTHTPSGRTLRYGEVAADAAKLPVPTEREAEDAGTVDDHRQGRASGSTPSTSCPASRCSPSTCSCPTC